MASDTEPNKTLITNKRRDKGEVLVLKPVCFEQKGFFSLSWLLTYGKRKTPNVIVCCLVALLAFRDNPEELSRAGDP